MKAILLFINLLLPTLLYSQGFGDDYVENTNTSIENDFGKYENGILTLKNGITLKEGDTLRLGYGSGPNKEFEFVYVSPANWIDITSGSVRSKQRLGSSYSNLSIIIKKIRSGGTKKTGYKWYLIVAGGNIVNYWCEIKEAIDTKEIVIPSWTYESSYKNEPISSKADEIKKLKDLFDSGAITEDEFNNAKTKIINSY